MRARTYILIAALTTLGPCLPTTAMAAPETATLTLKDTDARDRAVVLCEILRVRTKSPDSSWTLDQCVNNMFSMAMRAVEQELSKKAAVQAIEESVVAAQATSIALFPDDPTRPVPTPEPETEE